MRTAVTKQTHDFSIAMFHNRAPCLIQQASLIKVARAH